MEIQFKVIYLPNNEGHGNARRKSVEKCSNELIALMDADDISYFHRFESQLKCFSMNDELQVVGGQITEFIEDPSNIIGRREVPEQDREIKQYMKKRCPMNQVTVMFKKSLYNEVGGYIDWYCEEDYYLWIRMVLAQGVFANVPDDLVNVRIGDEMSSRRGGMKYFLSEARLQKYLLKKKIISLPRFVYNVILRFGGEVILTDKLRTMVFRHIRKSISTDIKKTNSNSEVMYRKDYIPFSVAMCVYGGDKPEYFDDALKSIVEQSIKPSEIVLVVDGPVPMGIESVIEKYKKICKGDKNK